MVTMEGADQEAMSHEKIFVSVRVRPLSEKEILNNEVSDWECINDNTIFYKNANASVSERSMYPSAYTFDKVFGSGCSTRKVYEEGAKEVALSAVKGINSSVFAYGQTSSGKTYTMTGITEYTIEDLYEYIQKHTERDFLLKFSAMEIYNESVRDLLSADTTPLRLLDDPERGTVVEKLTEETVRDRSHMIELLSICEAQRQIGETFLNETSSRSHQIIRLTIESSAREFPGKDNSGILTATVNFVDLAGSERASQSLSAGTRLKEGCHINRSLLTLGTVIRKLSKGRNGHIPFRDSKLTRILQPSLGGNARTAVICTMSPARVHVEQSRNTLLFASCAKEVTINAQVNVVMSDKALVKHLQRELARLESELRSPGSTSITAEYAGLLREKDIQIEKLEKEMKDVILQRDIAQSQLKEFLRVFGDDGDSVLKGDLRRYSNLCMPKSPESGTNPMSEASDTPEVDVGASSDGQSRNNSEDQYIQVLKFEENLLQISTPPEMVISTSNFSESDSCHEWDEIEKESNGTSEDLCKEVRCIEIEDFCRTEPNVSSYSHHDENFGFPALKVIGKEERADHESVSHESEKDRESMTLKLNEDRELLSMPTQENQEPVSPSSKKDGILELPLMEEEKELSCVHSVEAFYHEKPSLLRDLEKSLSGPGNKTLTKSRSCKARLMNDLSSSWFEMVENRGDPKPNGSDRYCAADLEDLERKISPLDFGPDIKTIFSGNRSHSSPDSSVDIKLEIPNGNSSTDKRAGNVDACYLGTKEKAELQQDKEVTENLVNENESRAVLPSKDVKDIGLDPIEDEFKNVSSWPSEFKRLQREIIELWNVCQVSLVHRTYFFLLFQGDPTDAIYMEVELRRLLFLRDTFARGEQTAVRGRTLSLASSIKALRLERRKLSKQMLKKLSQQERESLFLKWGIGLHTKLRRLQLAHRLWTSTEDENHINDSAYLVAKLVGFIEPGQAPKEMFSLDFAPRFASRTFSFKHSLLSLRL